MASAFSQPLWQTRVADRFEAALALHRMGRLDQAAVLYEALLAANPAHFDSLHMRGVIACQRGNHEEGLRWFERAQALKPQDAVLNSNRGNALKALGRLDAALAAYTMALAIKPDFPDALNNRGQVRLALQCLPEALADFERALSLAPDYAFLPGHALHVRSQLCDWERFEARRAALLQGIGAGRPAGVPFAVLALLDDPAAHLALARQYCALKYPPDPVLGEAPVRAQPARLRIGYFSADFHAHATAYLLAELLEAHDREHFEVIAFSFGPDRNDAMRHRLAAACTHFIDVRGRGDREVAAHARAMGIDIAVDLKGYTEEARPGIFAARAAPVQVSFLGYPGTSGAPYMDYLIADRVVIPPGSAGHYSEQIVHMPGCYQVNDARRAIDDQTPSRAEAGLPEKGFVFACFCNSWKIQPETFALWVGIVQAVEGSVLWLLETHAQAVAHLRGAAARLGLDPARLIFARRLPLAAHLARHRLADLALDTWPYNAHTTASDALWSGLPLLTLQGSGFAARVASSLLHALDLPELISVTAEDYRAQALRLANEPALLQRLKSRLQAQKLSAPLFSGQVFARQLEDAYRQMAARCQAGLPPTGITGLPLADGGRARPAAGFERAT